MPDAPIIASDAILLHLHPAERETAFPPPRTGWVRKRRQRILDSTVDTARAPGQAEEPPPAKGLFHTSLTYRVRRFES